MDKFPEIHTPIMNKKQKIRREQLLEMKLSNKLPVNKSPGPDNSTNILRKINTYPSQTFQNIAEERMLLNFL